MQRPGLRIPEEVVGIADAGVDAVTALEEAVGVGLWGRISRGKRVSSRTVGLLALVSVVHLCGEHR